MGSLDANGKWVNPNPGVDHETSLMAQSLTSYLGGWVDDSLRNPIFQTAGGNETRGNGTVVSWYRVQAGECHWYGHYLLGSTTSWPAGAFNLALPVAADATSFHASFASMCGSTIRAYDASGTDYYYGNVEFQTTVANVRGPVAGQTRSQAWTVNTVPFAFTTSDIVSWDLRYRVT